MIKLKFLTISFWALTSLSLLSLSSQEAPSSLGGHGSVKDLREAVRLYDLGMHGRSRSILEKVAREYGSVDAKGYSVLCDVMAAVPGYEARMNSFLDECPLYKLYRYLLFCIVQLIYCSISVNREYLKQ